ncbi:hypothetical protein CRG98_042900 [Punica granatum]|uniref:Uncharacterized protein n=1 Tax=Punica granatum TaxID=22663 RepID=A0A2I0HYE2_PUNGR|nr:hypothetical protein CRG98_042900 [Punica granatum]
MPLKLQRSVDKDPLVAFLGAPVPSGSHSVTEASAGLAILGHDLLTFEITSKVPARLSSHVVSSTNDQGFMGFYNLPLLDKPTEKFLCEVPIHLPSNSIRFETMEVNPENLNIHEEGEDPNTPSGSKYGKAKKGSKGGGGSNAPKPSKHSAKMSYMPLTTTTSMHIS